MNTDLLFVYGSLLSGDNEFGRYLMHNADFVAPAFFSGRLYDCGEYPGAIPGSGGYDIKGNIYRLNDVKDALIVLDDYEGFGDDQEQPNLFVRKPFNVTCNGEQITCWVYLYNLPVNGLKEITSGDYVAYLNA